MKTVKEYARENKISITTVYNRIKKSQLSAIKRNGITVILEQNEAFSQSSSKDSKKSDENINTFDAEKPFPISAYLHSLYKERKDILRRNSDFMLKLQEFSKAALEWSNELPIDSISPKKIKKEYRALMEEATRKKNEEIEVVKNNYKRFELFINMLSDVTDDFNFSYSKTTISSYVTVSMNSFVDAINILSSMGVVFKIMYIPKNKDTFSIRFSDHAFTAGKSSCNVNVAFEDTQSFRYLTKSVETKMETIGL